MDRDELIKRIQALEPEFAKIMRQFGAHEPDWEPLERLLLGRFMFMGYSHGLRLYKHEYTRRYLNLDEHGRTFRYLGKKGYEQIPIEEGIQHVFDEVEMLYGAFRDEHHPPQKQPKLKHFDSRERNRKLFAERDAQGHAF